MKIIKLFIVVFEILAVILTVITLIPAHREEIDYTQVERIVCNFPTVGNDPVAYTLENEDEIRKFIHALKGINFFHSDDKTLYESPSLNIRIQYKDGTYRKISGSYMLVGINTYNSENKSIGKPEFYFPNSFHLRAFLMFVRTVWGR